MITKKQLELLKYISKEVGLSGVCPSFEEMKVALKLKSKSGIHRLISGLEERGYIERLPHKARALNILKQPTISKSIQKQNIHSVYNQENSKEVVIFGKIAAGTPIEAIENPEGYLSVPKSMIKNNASYYALQVSGDSMKDAGILSGDLAILEKITDAQNGDIVVALIDNNEATLKRFRRKTASIALEPANANYETRIFGPDRIQIQGKLVGIIRNYN